MTNISSEARDVLLRAVAGEGFYVEPYILSELVSAGLIVVSGISWQQNYVVTERGYKETEKG